MISWILDVLRIYKDVSNLYPSSDTQASMSVLGACYFFSLFVFMIVSELSSVFPSLLSKLLLTSRSRVRLQIYSSHVVLNGLLPEPSWTELV